MVSEIEFRSSKLFKSDLINRCFRELFYSDNEPEGTSEKGLLKIILEEYLLIPAKGGSTSKLNEWSDTIYFTHVLNAMFISAKLLDLRLNRQYESNSTYPEDLEKFIRLFFSAVAMHDADKLFLEGTEGANNLDIILEKNKQKIIKICSYYLRSLGSPSEWWSDLVFLILRTENRTMDLANKIETKLNRAELATISQYVKLGDQVGGVKANTTDNIFSTIKDFISPFLHSLNEQLNFIHFSDLPQILLLDRLSSIFEKYLRQSGRFVLLDFPDAVAFLGRPLSEDDNKRICELFSVEVGTTDDNIKIMLDNFAPSGNSIRLDFSRNILTTPNVVKTYIEKFRGRLLIWQGEKWKNANPDFDVKARMIGIPIRKGEKNGKPYFYLEIQEESAEEGDIDIQRKRMLGLIACAQRVLYSCSDQSGDLNAAEHDLAIEAFGSSIFDNSDLLQRKTIEAISYAGLFRGASYDVLLEEYSKICGKISLILGQRFDKDNAIDYSEFFNRATGTNFLIQEPPDKSSMCVYCGIFAETPLKEENSFGIKATSGTGRKITVLKYDENKFNGKICKYCLRENTLRRAELGKQSEALCVHINLGDYYVPINLENLVDSLKETSSRTGEIKIEYEIEKIDRNITIRFGRRSKRELSYHMIFFTAKPRKRIEEFYFLSNVLDFILKTGVKVKLTSLMSSKRIFVPMLEWDNAPSWIKNLKIDIIRIDELESVNIFLKLIYGISRINGSKNAISWVIHDVNRGRRGLFQILWRSIQDTPGSSSLNKYQSVKEGVEWYMEKYEKELNTRGMEKIVDEACGISTEPPKSNNDNTWMIREAMKVYLRYFRDDDKDLKEKIAGRLWEYANRQKFSGKQSQAHCLGFSDSFVDLMRSDFKKRIPGNEFRKDLISQFALMYNIAKWRQIINKKREGEKNE